MMATSRLDNLITLRNGQAIRTRLQWLEDHRAIFLALQQKDSELAREASWRHLENSKNELIKIFKQDASISDFDDFFFAR